MSLTDAAPVPELGDREPNFRAEAATTEAYAVKLRNGISVATFVAKVNTGGAPVATWQEYLERSLAASPFAKDARIMSARPISVAGVECAVADVERVTNDVSFRERYYVLPGGDRWAFVKVLAPTDEFFAAADSVAEAVQATQGIAPSTERDPLLGEIERARMFKICAGALGAVLLGGWLRRRAAR